MQLGIRAFLFGTAALGMACSGVQTGDGGDDGIGCNFREEPLENLTMRPEGFAQTPVEILRPATDGVSGVLTMEDGRKAPVGISFVISDAPGLAVYREETPGVEDCKAEGVTVTGTMTIDGGALISATKTVEIRTLGPQFWIAGGGGQVSTTEQPAFDKETLDEPTLALPLQRDLDGTWHGDWRWMARVSSDGTSGGATTLAEAPFGTFAGK